MPRLIAFSCIFVGLLLLFCSCVAICAVTVGLCTLYDWAKYVSSRKTHPDLPVQLVTDQELADAEDRKFRK